MSYADGLKTPKHTSQTAINPFNDTKGPGIAKKSVGPNVVAASKTRRAKRRRVG